VSKKTLNLPFSKSVLIIGYQLNDDLRDVYDSFIRYFENLEYKILHAPIAPWRNPINQTNSKKNINDFVIENIDCQALLRIAATKLKINAQLEDSVDELCHKLFPSLEIFWNRLKHILSNIKPRFVIMGGDYSPEHYFIARFSEQLGIQVFALEISFLRDYFNMESITGMCCNNNSFGTWKWHYAKNLSLSKKDTKSLHEFIHNREKILYNSKESKKPSILKPSQIRNKLSIDKNKKVVLILSQLPHDCVITGDLQLYENLESFLVDSINAFEKLTGWHVVVRFHPLEKNYYNRTAEILKRKSLNHDRISFVIDQEINTYSLMKVAEFGITVNSQSGLEMIMEGKKVVVCGNCFYSRKGFTEDLNSAINLKNLVNYVAGNLKFSKQELITRDRFLWGYINNCLWKKDDQFIKDSLDAILSRYNTTRVLTKSKQKAFDSFCSVMANETYNYSNQNIKVLSEKLNHSQKRILIFGTGTTSTMLANIILRKSENISFCSSKITSMKKFFGFSCLPSNQVNYTDYDLILLTPHLESEDLYRSQISHVLKSHTVTEVYKLNANTSELNLVKLR
jgi:hypothetical protein